MRDLNQKNQKTGTYIGDGTTSLEIIGVGFEPKYLKIWQRRTMNNLIVNIFETTSNIVNDNADGGAINGSGRFKTNAIISLDSDGFKVDDGGTNAHPNQDGEVYNYLAIIIIN